MEEEFKDSLFIEDDNGDLQPNPEYEIKEVLND